jgi:hypothetical protein
MTDLYRKSSRSEGPKDERCSVKKGIGYGAFGGFIAIVAFTGVMLWMPISEGLPTGTFIAALGSSIAGMTTDAVLRGVIGFGLVVAQGIIVGIIFGVVTSKINALHPSGKMRGISFGLATGIIAFVILYVPFVSTITSNFTKPAAADTYTMGVHTDNNKNSNNTNNLIYYPSSSASASIPITFGYGLLAYLLYGFLLGGIVTLAYSVYRFDLQRLQEHNYNAEQ